MLPNNIPDAECVTAYGYSYGYFEIIYHVHYSICPTCGGPCIGCRESTVSTDDVFIYPNPAYDYFNLKFQSEDVIDPDQEIEIIITNLEGRSVGIWQITQFDNVDISNLPPGPYQVIIEIGNNERILKSLIKMK